MWLKDSVPKPTEFATIELPLRTCTQYNPTKFPDQYYQVHCYCGQVRVNTYFNEDCKGLPEIEDAFSTNCSRDIQWRLTEPCEPGANVSLTQEGCGEPLPWNRPTVTEEEDAESNTAVFAIFISMLVFWATL